MAHTKTLVHVYRRLIHSLGQFGLFWECCIKDNAERRSYGIREKWKQRRNHFLYNLLGENLRSGKRRKARKKESIVVNLLTGRQKSELFFHFLQGRPISLSPICNVLFPFASVSPSLNQETPRQQQQLQALRFFPIVSFRFYFPTEIPSHWNRPFFIGAYSFFTLPYDLEKGASTKIP